MKIRTRTGSKLRAEIDRCEICGAVFEPKADNRFKLTYCEPRTLNQLHPSGCTCAPRLFRECYLGMTFTRAEWERIAAGGAPDILLKFKEAVQRFEQGELIAHSETFMPFQLAPGETLFFVSSPVYLHEKALTDATNEPARTLYLTNERLVITTSDKIDLQIPIDNIKIVRESLPGFIIETVDTPTPISVFPPLYDPIYAAIEAVLRKYKRQVVR